MTYRENIRLEAIETARRRELRAADRAYQEGNTTATAGHLRQAGQLLDAINRELDNISGVAACV
jgi:hypothetical protein